MTMPPSKRNPLIERLAEAIRVIGTGATFERFGQILMDHYLGVPLSHRGLNVLGVPVSRELDTRDDSSRYVVEYSVEKGYFAEAMTKPEHDLAHALSEQPGAEHIFLLSAQTAPDGRISAFINGKKGRRALKGKTIHLWDARRIAEIIIDHLLVSDTAIDALAELLSEIGQIRDEFAAGNLVPAPDPRQVPRTGVEAELDQLFASGPCLVIWGIGGSGKSNAAAALAVRVGGQFELSVWFRRGEIETIEDLSAARLVRGGETRNVAALLKHRRCLLVLDDVAPSIDTTRLAALCGPGSKIIVTSRAEISGGYLLPMMSEDEARTLLNQDVEVPCPASCFDIIWGAVGGHPLSLGLLNKAVLEGASWSDIAADCAAIGELEAGDQRLSDRILGRLKNNLARELNLFIWGGQPRIDRRFLEFALKPLGRRKVEHHGLTTVDDSRTMRLHDIVFASLQAQGWLMHEQSAAFDSAFAEHIRTLYTDEALGLVALASTMKPKLDALVRCGDARPEFQLALLEIWEPSELDPALLPEPVESAQALASARIDQDPLAVSLILETVEGLWRSEAASLGPEAGKERYRARLKVFEILCANHHATDRQRAEIDHHHAKALNLLGEKDEARKLFEAVVGGPCPLPATQLQLIRIYARIPEMLPEAARLAAGILSAPAGSVTATVMLAVIEALPWGQGKWYEQLMREHADTIERTILETASVNLDQAYQTFASVGRNWVWNAPERLLRLFHAIPARSPAVIATDRNRFAYGELLRLVGKASHNQTYQAQALEAFALLEKPDDFQRQQYAQLLIDTGRATEAVDVLRQVEKPTPWSNYHLSRALLSGGDPDEALRLIGYSLDALMPATEKYRSTFLAHRYEIRRQLGHPQALADLDQAIAVCSDPKFLVSLQKRRLAT